MVECCDRSSLRLEAWTALHEALDRHDSIESGIARGPYFAHATFSKRREEFVGAKARTRNQRHSEGPDYAFPFQDAASSS
jgi:hypothetical protein